MSRYDRRAIISASLITCAAFICGLVLPANLSGPSLLFALILAAVVSVVSVSVIQSLLMPPLHTESAGRKKAEEEAHLAYRVLESSSEPVVITNDDAVIEYVNPAFSVTTGYSKEEVIGKNPRIMQSGRQDTEFYRDMWEAIIGSGRWQGQLWDRRKNGEEYPKWLTISAVKDDLGKVVKYIGVFTDITALKQTEEYIEYITQHDNVTGLPNRTLFCRQLQEEIVASAKNNRGLAVVHVGLSRIRHINDTFGHFAADLLTTEFAERLAGVLRKEDTVGRFDMDEFGLVLPGVSDAEEVSLVMEKISDQFSKPFFIRQMHEVFVPVHMGIALFPSDGDRMDVLMKNAQIALHEVKDSGGRKFQLFDRSMSNKAFDHLSLEANLRRALREEEFVLHYQPQVDLSSGRIFGMEALIRRMEDNWLVPPSRFIPLAEETGLIIPICEWTLLTACFQSKRWQDEGLPPLRLAINVTAGQFYQKTLIRSVKDALDQSGLAPEFIELELTERIIVHDSQEAIKMMRELKDMGVYLSIDDFGTGYSSLSYLRHFPIDKLKIDISFVRDIGRDPNSESIARAIIALAHSLNLKAIAEGVETKTQLDFLLEQGCDEIQGYYFSRPLPVDQFRDLVLSGKPFPPREEPAPGG